jgi:CDP-2,3-bis-(O-geranylgeranyl)-sn-glycerol synthase
LLDLRDPLTFFLALLPALVANASPVAAKGFARGVRWHPIDGGRFFLDGKRILGDGKTVEGFLVGIAAGALTSLLVALFTRDAEYVYVGSCASVGALLGDMAGSFIKRRLGLERGAPAPLLDQLDFYAGAVLTWWVLGYPMSLTVILAYAILVIALHYGTNYAAYKLGLKDVPW